MNNRQTAAAILGLILWVASFFVMVLAGAKLDTFLLVLGFVMFEGGAIMILLADKVKLNQFWLAGLLSYYPGFVITRIGISHHIFYAVFIGIAISILAVLLAFKGQIMYEENKRLAAIKEKHKISSEILENNL